VPLPPPAEHGPLLALVARMGRTANPMLLKLSGASDLDVRYYATVLLASCAEPAILPALAARIYDADPPTREAALRGLGGLNDAPGIIPVLDRLRADLLGPDRVRQKYAIQGVAALRHGPAVPRLIELLDHKERGIVAAAQRALVVLTGQDYVDSQRKWRAWWERNKHLHRLEWLIDALGSADPGLMQSASDELTETTGEHFGFYADLPRKDREQAAKRWVEWWNEKGKKRFGG
jgi:HEAT repeat protein